MPDLNEADEMSLFVDLLQKNIDEQRGDTDDYNVSCALEIASRLIESVRETFIDFVKETSK